MKKENKKPQVFIFISRKLVDKIDKDNDGFVTEEELMHWIQYVQRKYITDDTERMWSEHEHNIEDDKLTWESYRKQTYGYDHGNYSVGKKSNN